jgi:hypothetical protein
VFKWLRQRRETRRREAEDANRLTKPSNQAGRYPTLIRLKSLSASSGSLMRATPALPVTSSARRPAVASAATVARASRVYSWMSP